MDAPDHTARTFGNHKEPKPVVMSLVGIDGNAFAIMGEFRKNARRQGWTPEEIKAVLDEAMTGDYDHLIQTILKHTIEDEDEE